MFPLYWYHIEDHEHMNVQIIISNILYFLVRSAEVTFSERRHTAHSFTIRVQMDRYVQYDNGEI